MKSPSRRLYAYNTCEIEWPNALANNFLSPSSIALLLFLPLASSLYTKHSWEQNLRHTEQRGPYQAFLPQVTPPLPLQKYRVSLNRQ